MEALIARIKLFSSLTSLLKAVCEGDVSAVNALLKQGTSVDEEYLSVRPLHVAAYKGFKQIVERLLDYGAYVNYKCVVGGEEETALHIASEKGNENIVRLLLDRGADPNARNKNGKTPLHYTAGNVYFVVYQDTLAKRDSLNYCQGDKTTSSICFSPSENKRVTEILLSYGAEIDVRDSNGQTPLHVAVQKKSMVIAEMLLNNGASVNTRRKTECEIYSHASPICSAVKNVDIEMLELLLRYGGEANVFCNRKHKMGFRVLHYAAQLGCKKAVELLINHGAVINAKDEDGKTPLYYSLENDRPEVYELLLSCGAEVRNVSALVVVARKGNLETFEFLLQRKAGIHETDQNGSTCLHLSLSYGHEKLAGYILNKGPSLCDVKDGMGNKPIHVASRKGLEIVRDLLKFGSGVNSVNNFGNTPLHYAIESGNISVAKLLLENSAKVDVANKFGETPLYCGICVKSTGIVSSLLDHGASVNEVCYAMNKGSFTPLRIAVEKKMEEMAKLLIVKGADVNTLGDDEQSVLYVAVRKNYVNIVRTLLEFGADVNNHREGKTLSLHSAVANENEATVDLLLNAGIDIKSKDVINENTVLHIAVMKGRLKIIESLLRRGADVDSRNKFGQTALHIAAEKGSLNIIKLLMKYGANIDSRNRFGKTALYIAAEKRFSHVVVHLLDNEAHITELNKLSVLVKGDTYRKQMYAHIFGILKSHSVKMMAKNLSASDKKLSMIYPCKTLRDFLCDCEAEITRLMCETVVCGVTFYDILNKPFKQMVAYVRNENVLQVLDSCDFKKKFPIYASILECRYLKAKDEISLFDSAADSLNNLIGFTLPYVVIIKIFSYVGINVLRCLCNASDKHFKLSGENFL